jgi:hypothetical protein
MAGKLIAGAVGAVKIAASAAKHVVWYVSHQIDRRSR